MICKSDDCDNETHDAPARGPYTGLCADCRSRKGREMASRRRGTPRGRPPEENDPDSFEQKAKSLVIAGRRVDQTLAAVRLQALGLDDAKTLARQALEHWRTTCERLAGASVGR